MCVRKGWFDAVQRICRGFDNGRTTAFSTLSGAEVYEEAVTKSIIGRGDFTLHSQMQHGDDCLIGGRAFGKHCLLGVIDLS